MWLVLCPSDDVSAFWAYRGLRSLGLEPLELVTAELLAISLRWEHRLGQSGSIVRIDLADGRTVRSDATFGVLNRLVREPPLQLHKVRAVDRNYAAAEFSAFCLSWLNTFSDPVLNRATPQGLSGRWRTPTEWAWLAARAALPTPDHSLSSADKDVDAPSARRLIRSATPVKTVIVVSGHTVSTSAPTDILKGCVRLATVAETALLGVEFADGPCGPWTFVGATPLPDLRLGGDALLSVLAKVLRGGSKGR
jgi:hypothetical protein